MPNKNLQLSYPFWVLSEFLAEYGETGCEGCERFIGHRDDLEHRLSEQQPPDGKEAEELRTCIETLMKASSAASYEDMSGEEYVNTAALQNLLDTVDARDSLHHLQREDLAKAAQAIQEHKLSVLTYTSSVGVQFEVADKPPPGRPIRAIGDDRRKAIGHTLVGAVETWLREHAEDDT